MNEPAYIDAATLMNGLPVGQAADALADAFAQVLPTAPERMHVPLDDGELLLMPAHGALGAGVKLLTLNRANPERGLPLIQGVFALFAPDTLALEAVFDGAALTALRTAAVSALATRLLANEHAERLVLFGAGRQAHAHLEAMCAVRPVRWVGVVEPSDERAAQLVEAARRRGLEADCVTADAVANADLVCTCTTSATPVLDGSRVAAGAHVNATGAYRSTQRELDAALLARARVVVETREAALAEAGDLIIPLEQGELPCSPVVADLAELVAGQPVRTSRADVTVFKSVGVAFEDLIVARAARRRILDDPVAVAQASASLAIEDASG